MKQVKMNTVVSSNVARIGYEPDIYRLHIEFKNGACYEYANVSMDLYEKIMDSESIGRAIQQHLVRSELHPAKMLRARTPKEGKI